MDQGLYSFGIYDVKFAMKNYELNKGDCVFF